MEISSTSSESSDDSSGDTDPEEEKLSADVEEVSLVVKVTPEIAREFQVNLIENNFLF